MLVDSNIIIYAAQTAHEDLRSFIAEHAPAVPAVSYVEVLGYIASQSRNSSTSRHFSQLPRSCRYRRMFWSRR